MTEIKRIPRQIYFYDLTFPNVPANKVRDTIRQAFSEALKLNKAKSPKRFDSVTQGEKNLMRDIQFFGDKNNFIKGKIIRLREDAFPQIFKEGSDSITDIDVEDEDSIAETTHFIVDMRKSNIVLALESNFHGPKFTDVGSYITMMLIRLQIGEICIPVTRTKDDLFSYIRRMNRVSEFMVSVHKDEINRVAGFDKGLFTACEAAEEFGDSEFVNIHLKFDWEKVTTTPFTDKVKKMVTKLLGNDKYNKIFNKLVVRAEDEDKRNTIQAFDLLSDKVKSEVKVQRHHKTKVVISTDMFEKLEAELQRLIG